MSKPVISVVIPLYNHEKYIESCLLSVLNQSYQDFEIIIINDGSTDRSEEVVKTVRDNRIRYVYQTNQGAAQAINRGIKLGTGEFISILNSDDLYLPDRLQTLIQFSRKNNQFKAFFGEIEIIDSNDNFVRNKNFTEDNYFLLKEGQPSFKDDQDFLVHLLSGNFLVTTSNLLCLKSIFDEIGYFRNLKYTHDYDFFLRLAYHCRNQVYYHKEPLLKYRLHSANSLKSDLDLLLYEISIVLAEFISSVDFNRLFSHGQNPYDLMAKFLNSFNRFNLFNTAIDKIILTAVLFKLKFNGINLYDHLIFDSANPFRQEALNRFRKEARDNLKEYLSYSRLLLTCNVYQQELLAYRQQLNRIYTSRPYRLLSTLKTAQKNIKMFPLLPFQWAWILLPDKIKNRIKGIVKTTKRESG